MFIHCWRKNIKCGKVSRVRDYRRFLVIGVILLASAGLRLADLGRQGLFIDEAWSWAASRLSLTGLYHLTLSDPHPPLYYLLLKLILLVIPGTQFGLRLLSAGFSIACLGIVLVFVSSRWNIETVIYVGLLAGLSTFDIYYAQEARMYTLLAFLWIASYISLVKALEGERKYLLLWPILAALMAWTHFYGVIVAFTFVLFVVGWGARRMFPDAAPGQDQLRWGARRMPDQILPLLAGATCVLLSALLPLGLALTNAAQNDIGGAWIPTPRDLPALFLLFSAGLAAVRTYFLDSAHLVLPSLSVVPTGIWIAVGLAVSGLPAAWGLVTTWLSKTLPVLTWVTHRRWAEQSGNLSLRGRSPKQSPTSGIASPPSAVRNDNSSNRDGRAQVALAILLMVLPVALVFGYGALTDRRVWALKPFLGAAILFYIWAGIGIGSIKFPLLRRCLGVAIVILALASLVPYFNAWQKTTAGRAFHALPAQVSRQGVIIEPSYQAPLAFYYLDDNVPVYSLAAGDGDERVLVRITPSRQDILGLRQPVQCETLASTADLWVYGSTERIRQAIRNWPGCVTQRRLWIYQDGAWQPLE
jgi:hypothetical protein